MLTGSDKDLHGLNDSNTNFSVVCVNITGEVEERENIHLLFLRLIF